MKRYYFLLNREYFRGNEYFERNALLMMQGLIYGLCSIPCDTTLFDIELTGNFVIFAAECDEERAKKFMKSVERWHPGINEFIILKEES